jgi:hypothetical protein
VKLTGLIEVLVRFDLYQFTKQSRELVNYLLCGTHDQSQAKTVVAMTSNKIGVQLNSPLGKMIYRILPQRIIESDEVGVSKIYLGRKGSSLFSDRPSRHTCD